MKRTSLFYVVIGSFIALLCALPTPTHAHVDGPSWEKIEGTYHIDVGYEPDPFISDQPVVLDFELRDASSSAEVPFSHMWVKIERDDSSIFATGIRKAELGKTTLLFTFPSPGKYELSVRFHDQLDALVETTFPLRIESKQLSFPTVWVIPVIAILTVVGVLWFTIFKK